MKRSIAWIVPGAALVLASCTVQAQPTTSALSHRTTGIDLTRACPGTRWIAALRSAGNSCPAAPGFRSCRLTDASCRAQIGVTRGIVSDEEDRREDKKAATADAEKLRSAALRSSGLDRFCVYDSTSGAPSTPRLPSREVLQLDKDCQSSAGLGSDLEAMTWKPLQSQFLQQAGRTTSKLKPKKGKVRLAILDTQATEVGVPSKRGCSPHGYTLAQMAQNLVCETPGKSSEGCAAQISTRLALSIKNPSPAFVKAFEPCEGGLVGWIGDLATAIVDEVDAWGRAGREERLILNLSVGWDPQLFGGLRETKVEAMDAQVQAVYRALVYAAKYNVLVVAAAGNATPGPKPHEGPLLPAAWEAWVHESGFAKKANTKPLIYAVGGVRWNNQDLPNSRPKATPPRVAYGDHAVVGDPASKEGPGKGPTANLTGTSVATLIVSAAAALAWGDKPSLSPAEVMQYLEQNRAAPTGLISDFGAQSGTRARRICLGGAESCRGEKTSLSFTPSLESFSAPTFDASVLVASTPQPPCKGAAIWVRPGAPTPASLCPCDQFESVHAQPWVDPQPGASNCNSCSTVPFEPAGGALFTLFPPLAGAAGFQAGSGKKNPVSVYIEIEDSWWVGTSSLEATTLEISYSNGDQPGLTKYIYSLNQSFSKNGSTSLKVTGLQTPPFVRPIVRSASVNFLVVREGIKMSLSSPLFFSP